MSEISSPFIELSVKPSLPAVDKRLVHCEEWHKSGLSMSEYCRRSGISISSLSGWVKKFNFAEKAELKKKSDKVITHLNRKQGLEVILISGIKLRFVEIINISEVIRLLKAMESCS